MPDTNEDNDDGCDHVHVRFMKHKSKSNIMFSQGRTFSTQSKTFGGDSIHHHTSLKKHHMAEAQKFLNNKSKIEPKIMQSGDFDIN